MADVFISYSQRVPEPTVAVADALTKRGFRPWYDVDLLPGQFFGKVIDDAIDRAQAVVTIWSPPALISTWVPAESARALQQKKLICVRTPDVAAQDLPTPFNRMHVPHWSELDGLFQALIGLGVRPSGVGAETDLDALRNAAQADWRAMPDNDIEALEAYLEEYGALAMYRRMAEKRLQGLRALGAAITRTPAPVEIPEAPPVRPEDVILRLNPQMHTAAIQRISVSADGRLMATASYDKTIKLWSLPEGRLIRTLRPPIGPGDEGKVYAVTLDPAGRWVAAGGWMSKTGTTEFVSIFDVETGRVLRRLGQLPFPVADLDVSPDGARLAAGLFGANGIRVWDASALSRPGARGAGGALPLVFEDRDYGDSVFGLDFAADGRLAATSFDGDLRLYARDGRRIARAMAPGGKNPYGVAFGPGGGGGADVLALGYDDTTRVDLHDARDLKPVGEADTGGVSGGSLSSVAFFGPGRALLAAGGRYHSGGALPILTWDQSGRGARSEAPGADGTILDLAPLTDGSLAFGAYDPAFGLLDADGTRRLFRGPETADLRGKHYEHFTLSADGRRLRFGLKEWSAAPVLFDLATRTLTDAPAALPDLIEAGVSSLPVDNWIDSTAPTLAGRPLALQPYETAFSLAVAPDAQSFVLGTHFRLRRFDKDGKQLWEQPVPGTVWGVNLAPEGTLIVAAYGDGTIRWHQASDGKELLALFIHLPQGPDGPREWILFTPEGYYEASSAAAEQLIGWHVNRGPDEAADFYPVDKYASVFRRPDKIAAALDGM